MVDYRQMGNARAVLRTLAKMRHISLALIKQLK